MKRGILFASIIIILSIALIFTLRINNKNITGQATTQETSLNITVFQVTPTLTISSPKNETYLSADNILLNFTSLYADNFLYNLDNSVNSSLSSTTNFNTTLGSHTLYLYANNSNATISKNVTFYINNSRFVVKDSSYDAEEDDEEDYDNMSWTQKKGESTNLLNYTYEELQNLSNLTLHQPNIGKISFNELINLTNDSIPEDNRLDLNNYTNISFNRIEIDSTTLPNLNKSATLTLYGLTFTNPRILRDGDVCPSTICTMNSYSGGTLSFNVNSFSVYSTEETPSSSGTGAVTSSSGGGGGSTTGILTENFSVNQEKILVKIKQGEVKTIELTIKNNGDKNLTLSVESQGSIVSVREKNFILNKNEEKIIHLDFIAKEDTPTNLYLEKLIIKSQGMGKEIFIAEEVVSKDSLFDVKLSMPERFKVVHPGDWLDINVEVFNFGDIGRVDANLEYFIQNETGGVIVHETETVAVETSASLNKNLILPKDIKEGNYMVYVKVNYDDKTASASSWFTVTEKTGLTPIDNFVYIILITLLLVIIILGAIIYELRKIKKGQKPQISETTLLNRGMIKKKAR